MPLPYYDPPRRYRELYQRLAMSNSWDEMNLIMKTHKF